ncbi:hypothetical protein ACWGCW_00705 [Streptomyces sp. NPDC054933]
MTAAVLAPPLTTCACCDRPIPVGLVWCSWLCRNLDDPHDDHDDTEQEQAA